MVNSLRRWLTIIYHGSVKVQGRVLFHIFWQMISRVQGRQAILDNQISLTITESFSTGHGSFQTLSQQFSWSSMLTRGSWRCFVKKYFCSCPVKVSMDNLCNFGTQNFKMWDRKLFKSKHLFVDLDCLFAPVCFSDSGY